MRSTFVLAVFALSGCFSPRLADGGFACDPTDPKPCPDGLHCLAKDDIFVCTTATHVQSTRDMAMADTGGDMAMRGDMALALGDMASGGPIDMASGGPIDMAMTSCTLASVTINEVQTGTSASANDEFIELYNSCNGVVSLSGSLVYRSKAGSTDIVLISSLSGKSIAAKSWFLATGSGYLGTAMSDVTYPSGLADTGGGLALRDSGGNIVDSMGWGGATDGFQQGTPCTNLHSTMSRIPDGANGHNNVTDFTDSNTPTPRAANKP
jgi:hypothetical protein